MFLKGLDYSFSMSGHKSFIDYSNYIPERSSNREIHLFIASTGHRKDVNYLMKVETYVGFLLLDFFSCLLVFRELLEALSVLLSVSPGPACPQEVSWGDRCRAKDLHEALGGNSIDNKQNFHFSF